MLLMVCLLWLIMLFYCFWLWLFWQLVVVFILMLTLWLVVGSFGWFGCGVFGCCLGLVIWFHFIWFTCLVCSVFIRLLGGVWFSFGCAGVCCLRRGVFGLIVVYAWLFAGFGCCLWLLFGCCLGVCLVVVLGLLV